MFRTNFDIVLFFFFRFRVVLLSRLEASVWFLGCCLLFLLSYPSDALFRVDHGLVVRKKAKQVLKLLMEDDYLKEERARAQKLTKSIFGQGSYQSSNSSSGTSRYGGFGNTSSSSASTGLMHDDDTDEYHSDKKFTAFEERILSEKRGSRTEKTKNGNGESTTNDWRAFDDDTGSFISNQNAAESNWADFSVSKLILGFSCARASVPCVTVGTREPTFLIPSFLMRLPTFRVFPKSIVISDGSAN